MLYYIILKLYPIISTFSKINKSLFGLLIIDIIAYMYNLSRPKRVPVVDENGNPLLTFEDEVDAEQKF